MSKGDRLDRLFQILRLSGAAMILAAAGTFLVQSWGDAGDVVRYLGLLGATALVPIVAYVCGVRLHEGRSARTLVLTFLALLPIHAALLGAFVLSRADGSKPALTSIAQWVAPSTAIATALIILSATAALDTCSSVSRILPSRNSAVFTQGMSPSKYSGWLRLGVAPLHVFAKSPIRRQSHASASGVANLLRR